MILPENEFSHLKGVNKQPYLDIRASSSQLTKIFLFPVLHSSLFIQLRFLHSSNRPFPSCIFVKTSLNTKPFISFPPTDSAFHDNQTHFYMKGFHKNSFWNRHKETFIHELLTGAFDLGTEEKIFTEILPLFIKLLLTFLWYYMTSSLKQIKLTFGGAAQQHRSKKEQWNFSCTYHHYPLY